MAATCIMWRQTFALLLCQIRRNSRPPTKQNINNKESPCVFLSMSWIPCGERLFDELYVLAGWFAQPKSFYTKACVHAVLAGGASS